MLTSLITRTRRNHALEHATLNLLSRAYPGAQAIGVSGPRGFTIFTSLTAEEVVPAVMEALKRLKAGEHGLRVHKNCGTNLVVTATLTTSATLVGIRGQSTFRQRLERLPHLILLNVIALLVAPPLAEWIQAHITTDPNVDTLEIASVFTDHQNGLQRIRVHMRQI
ncbi:MAG TPA: DUF6391 domain-containing protein [Anaerolineae bacterium]|nr:DUF6391 domain-containing protein [Anaerolineae bacterium]HQK15351.1 DUF6391 domain-containing protein [Anaerolineae bacterium]